MTDLRSRFSRRHLLALCTFLAPLLVLAVLGFQELERQGQVNQVAVTDEARTFADGAAKALAQQLESQLTQLLDASRSALARSDVLPAVREVRDQGYSALLDIVLLDDQDTLVWPSQPQQTSLSLPFARDARVRSQMSGNNLGLEAVDLLLTTGHIAEAEPLLQHLLQMLELAAPGRNYDVATRFRLATVLRRLNRIDEAKAEFDRVRKDAFPENGFRQNMLEENTALGLLAETALAELGDDGARVDLLAQLARDIADGRRYALLSDSLVTAVTERISEGVTADPLRHRATELLRDEYQRAQTRAYASDCDYLLLREARQRRAKGGPPPHELQLIATLGVATTMLWVRDATPAEQERHPDCKRIGMHIDLGLLLAPALEPFLNNGRFTIAIDDPDDVPLVAAPANVPTDYSPPNVSVRGLTVRAFPSYTYFTRLREEATAQAQRRTVLLLALFGAAMAGALWLWRSVSNEAELARLKVELVSRVSHELKTPLALIRMYGETLELGRTRDGEQAMHFGGIIARESERLTSMIQRILDFSRQQAGTLRYHARTFDLGELVQRVSDAYTPHLESRGAVLIDTTRPGVQVHCDESACESAIVNLLENATKYGIEGDDEHEIEIDLAVRDRIATLEVRDRGRGIPSAELEQVFDPLFRASNSGEVRGAGIGLSLVRHFARAHGGDVRALPRDGGGTIFRLTLPVAGARAATPAMESA